MAGRALYQPGAVLRTGLTHFFERRTAGAVDRSEVARFWKESSSGAFGSPTPNVCSGFVQANMVCVQKEHAYDFLQFCLRNPQPCPLLDVSEAGVPKAPLAAPGADLRSAVPRYRIWRDGVLTEDMVPSVEDVWAETVKMMHFVVKRYFFNIENEELCITNDEFCRATWSASSSAARSAGRYF